MIKETNQTIYKCEYCTMVSKSSAAMYSHELSCKKNPHNDILCLKCGHCEPIEIVGEKSSACRYCDIDKMDESLFPKMYICEGCHGYGADRTHTNVYRCNLTGKMMYSKDIARTEKGKRQDILEICDCMMRSRADGCDNFIKKR